MNARVLVVDDEDILIRCYQRILEGGEYHIDYVRSGRDALQKIEESKFDLVILDYLMPEMNGMEALQCIRERQPDLKVIMVTGLNQNQTEMRAKALGVFDYLPKPFDPVDLKHVVEHALAT